MQKSTVADSLLMNINNIHELGRQRAFELGNPFYAKYEEDGEFYRKELPNGELFLVKVKIVTDENDMPISVEDTIIKKLII